MSTAIAFDGLNNVRDLGGIVARGGRRIREGRLIRSDQLFFASDADRAKLERLGIGLVVDFRSSSECREKPDPDLPGVAHVHLPIVQDVRAGIVRDEASNRSALQIIMGGRDLDLAFVDRYMNDMYRQFVLEPQATSQYARFIDEVIATLRENRCALWHCTAGKDRAGFATVVLLEALGVPRDVVVADYLQTNEHLEGVVAQLIDMLIAQIRASGHGSLDEAGIEQVKTSLARFFCADEAFLAGAYEAADEQYGGFDGFLERALGVDGAKRELLCELCLD